MDCRIGGAHGMREIELQSDFIIARNLLPQPALRQAIQQAEESGVDLVSVLVDTGQLEESVAEQIRQAVRNPQEPTADFHDAGRHMVDTVLTQSPESPEPPESPGARDPNQSPTFEGINRYQIIRQMGHGGVGNIYLAQHRGLKQDVALKLIRNPTANKDILVRFEREAQTLARFKHPNIVRVMDYGDDGGNPFIVMELIDGKDLKQQIESFLEENKQLPDWQWTVGVLDPIADALDACHKAGIIHRDLKPQNILIESKTDRPVLVDFGLVKPQINTELSQTSNEVELTVPDSVLGTPAYLSPEQIDSSLFGSVGPHTDVWAFGATLFYCLTGELPFGLRGGVLGLCMRITQNKAPSVTDKNPQVPKSLAVLCRRCLDKKAEDRPSIAEVRQVLDDLMPKQVEFRKHPVSKVLGAALVMLILAIAIGIWFMQAPPAELQSVDPLPQWTSKKQVQIGGQCSPSARVIVEQESSGTWVLVNSADLAADGRFDFVAPLNPGINRFRVRVDGDEDAEPKIVEIGRDIKPPRVIIDHSIAAILPLATPNAKVTGKVLDDAPAKIWINDQEIPLDEDQRFSYTLKPDAFLPLQLRIRARDAVDNEIQTRVTVYKHLLPLMDANRWNSTAEDIQDQAIGEIAHYLSTTYRHIETKKYVCGSQAHRIAVFQHRRSGIILHLIPGGAYEMGNLDPDLSAQAKVKAIKAEIARIKELEYEEHPMGFEPKATRDEFNRERPTSKVTIPPMFIGRYEVLQRHWNKIAEKPKALGLGSDDHPQVWVTYDEVQLWLKEAGDGLRLASEAEWEYACRAGSTSTYFWGQELDMTGQYSAYWLSVLNTAMEKHLQNPEQFPRPELSKLKPISILDQPRQPNAFGLVDMLGNVWEFCSDVNYGYGLNPPVDHLPRGGQNPKHRTKRGGGFLYGGPGYSRCANRGAENRDASRWALGFRVARSLAFDDK